VARRQTDYAPVLEDWLTHFILPAIGYAALMAAAVLVRSRSVAAAFTVAATSLVLLFTSIHNAWDSVTYVAHQGRSRESGNGA